MFDLAKGLVLNLTMLVGLVAVYGWLRDDLAGRHKPLPAWAIGAVFGFAAVGTMLTAFHPAPGLIFDTRVAPLAFASLLGGLPAALVAVIAPLAMRWHVGGIGMPAGFIEILAAAVAGLVYRGWLKRKTRIFSMQDLWKFSLVVCAAVVMGIGTVYGLSSKEEPLTGGDPDMFLFFFVIIPMMIVSVWVLGRMIIFDRERVATARRLDETELRFKAFLSQSEEALWVWEVNPPGDLSLPAQELSRHLRGHMVLVEANDKAIAFLGGSQLSNMYGRTISDLYNMESGEARRIIDDFVDAGAHFFETTIRLPGGSAGQAGKVRYFINRMQGIVEDNKIVAVWSSLRDITEQKEAEARAQDAEHRLMQAQRMQSVGTLASGIAHDFKNVLVPIVGRAELAQKELRQPEKMTEHLAAIQKAAKRGADLVKQMLAYARPASELRESVDLKMAVEEVLDILKGTVPENIDIQLICAADNYEVQADSAQMHQVVLNLVRNAQDALLDGGVVQLSLQAGAKEVTLAVSDNGQGMSDEILERIFEPFFTTKDKNRGTGLGLYVVHQIVRGHEGRLTVESKPENGTTFKVVLPRGDKQPLVKKNSVKKRGKSDATILLVDDDNDVREVICKMIVSLGYSCIEASSADAAERALDEEGADIDLVLTDLGMPGRGGLAFARDLQSRAKPPKVLVITGDGIFEQSELEAAGVIATLEKPVTFAMLSENIERALETLSYIL